MRVCIRCNIEKSLDDFYYHKNVNRYDSRCLECNKEYLKQYYTKNKEKILNRSILYYDMNTEKVLNKIKEYRKNNTELIKKRRNDYYLKNSEKIIKKTQKWREENREKRNKTERERRKKDPQHKLIHYLRVRTNFFLKKKNSNKNEKFLKILGCSPEFLKEYIESKFTEGMSWDIFGTKIHIDHIIPLSSANTREEICKLCHYTNLQPLWAQDNLKKSNKIL